MPSLYDYSLKTLDGRDMPLAEYKGKAVLLVNVASACGYTPQYAGLQTLYEEYKDEGLVVAGIPSNDFGAQEPGTDAEIQTFCTGRYHVTFPMFAKIPVKGADKNPLYQWLTTTAPEKGDVGWNFEKFLVGRDGTVVGRFRSNVTPQSPELRTALASALG